MIADWRELAACKGRAPIFDATIDDEGRETKQEREDRYATALAICAQCPVQRQCAADTLIGRDEGVRFGIVLRPLQVQRKVDRLPAEIKHGTEGGAQTHRRRGVPFSRTCGCLRAERQAKVDRQKRRGRAA